MLDSSTTGGSTIVPLNPVQHACPNCGYCPHCGRGGAGFWPTYPWSPWPTYPAYPYWSVPISSGGTYMTGNTTVI